MGRRFESCRAQQFFSITYRRWRNGFMFISGRLRNGHLKPASVKPFRRVVLSFRLRCFCASNFCCEQLHAGRHVILSDFDVGFPRRRDIAVTHAEFVEVTSEASPERVPAVPLNCLRASAICDIHGP